MAIRWLLAAIAVLGVGSTVAAGCGGAAHHSGRPTTYSAVRRFRIDATPIAAVGVAGKLWVGDALGAALYEVDPRSGRTIAKHRIDRDPNSLFEGMVLSERRLWIAYDGESSNWLRPVNVRTGTLGRARKTPEDSWVSAAAVLGAIYVGTWSTITRVEEAGGRPLVYAIPHSDPTHNGSIRLIAIAATPTAVWAALRNYSIHTTTLVRYDPRTLRPLESLDLTDLSGLDDFFVTSLLASGNSVWAASVEGPVLRLASGRVAARIDFPNSTSSLLADRKGVWVVEARDGKLDHISYASGKVDETIAFAGATPGLDPVNTPRTLSALPGQLWVTDYKTGSAYRITLPRRR
jgi:hypothetical protein